MHARREGVNTRLLRAGIEDTNFGVRHTAIEAGLGVRLVLNLTVALVWSCALVQSISMRARCSQRRKCEAKVGVAFTHVGPFLLTVVLPCRAA